MTRVLTHAAAALGLALAAAAETGGAPAVPPDFEIRMDPRAELLAMAELAAGGDVRFSGFHRHDLPYVRSAEAWFKPHAGHPAARLYAELSERGLGQNRLFSLAFAMSPPPSLRLEHELDEPLAAAAGGKAAIEEFRRQLEDFGRASRFLEFWRKSEAARAALVEDAKASLQGLDARRELERYTGLAVKTRYTVVLSPFASPVLGFSVTRRDPDGALRLVNVYGPDAINGATGFHLNNQLGQISRSLLFEELVMLAEPHRMRLEASRALDTGRDCAEDWYDCAQRNIAFAVGARIMDLNGNRERAAEWPSKYARIGITSIGPLVDALRTEFEPHRDRYPTLMDFYPSLLATLEAAARRAPKALDFHGDMRDILRSPGPAVVIAPASGPVRDGLEAIRRARWPDAKTLSGRDALKADLKGKLLLVGGTPADNEWLASRLKELQLPLRFDGPALELTPKTGDTARVRHEGSVGFVSGALNPDDPRRPLLLYTGTDERSAAAALGAGELAGDFAVLDGGRLLTLGIYEKTRLPWRVR